MEIIGEIKPPDGGQLSNDDWINLIATHPALSKPPAREGINPFTKEPHIFYPRGTSAQIVVEGTKIGSICWVEDDSELPYVTSLLGHETTVSKIAIEIANRLNCYFTRVS